MQRVLPERNSQPSQTTARRVSSVLICYPDINRRLGGSQTIVCDIAEHMIDHAIKVYIADVTAERILLENYATKKQVILNCQRKNLVYGSLMLSMYVNLIGIDVVHGHLNASFLAALSARLAGVPSVRTIHGRLNRPGMLALRERLTFQIAISLLGQKVVAVSDKVTADLERFYRLRRGIDLFEIPNGCKNNLPQAPSYTGQGKLVFVFAGRFHALKGFYELLTAFQRAHQYYPHLQLYLIGEGAGKHAIDPQLVASQAIVVSEGWLSRQQVLEILQTAHIFVLPSHSEGLSIALLEAMAMGLVPLVSQAATANNLVMGGVNGCVFTSGSVAELFARMCYLASGAAPLQQYRQRAINTVGSHFTLTRTAHQYTTLYNTLISEISHTH